MIENKGNTKGGGHLKTIVLIMWRASLAQGLIAKMYNIHKIQLYYEPDYTKAASAISSHLADGVLLEVSEDGVYDISFCLSLCAWMRKFMPRCRIMLMCPEGQKEAVHRTIEAKQKGEIDDFVFYDVSLDYLTATLQSL